MTDGDGDGGAAAGGHYLGERGCGSLRKGTSLDSKQDCLVRGRDTSV